MKVLYITSTLKKAGPTSQLYYILSNLAENITPVLITLSPEPTQSRLADFEMLGIRIYQLKLSRIEGLFLAQKKVQAIVESEKPRVIHSQGYRGDLLASNFAKLLPVVCTVRNFPQLDFAMTYGRFIGRGMAYRQSLALRKVACVCAVSDAVNNNLEQTYDITDAVTVLNGVDTEKFYRANIKQKTSLRKQYGISEKNRVWISSLGKDSRKNSVTVATAFKRFLTKNPEDMLIFIGDGLQRDECEKIAAGNQQFKFFGKVSNVSDYLQMADYFVSASRAEGMPNAVLEAMACGLPSILSDIAPHNEIHSLNPDGCIVFETESHNDLYDKLVELVKVEQNYMADATFVVVNEHFSSKAMSTNYQQLYRELVQKYE
ncbi:glycosyltransferase involved in cell wall biosynthesis [Marinomonas alcarazii]|uniref:Glycosyltransferase involved in cell wall biosynthesis n=1 Tax=Marinomonas alcarazii TaxID=491949 RepID=A0A318V7B4_9GAMM|nr:glycosyltransferase family 4 protein [Marinomonas alcarazii]PYF79859.1 glycosyltransferase involved in cell wall biosynthesis [Marinomonas alcarazii]